MGVINKTTEEINTLLDKVESMPEEGVVGKTPVLETGTTTTLPAGSNATSEVVSNGTDENGNPKYKLNFGIPKGADGSSSGGGETVDRVEWSNVLNKPTWVNSSTKPTYTAAEVGALPASTTIPSKTSQLTNDSKFVASDGLKTINGQSIVGIGNIEISGSGSGIADAPSDGKTYGRKNGNWAAIEGVGGSVDITDIINRLAQLEEVDGTCTDEDYNTLKRYIENGTVTYCYIDENGLIVDLKKIENIILIEFGYTSGFYYINSSMSISGDKHVSVSEGIYLSNTHMGEGVLGEYNKPTSYSAITANDTISGAIGKLEAGISNDGSSDVYYLPDDVQKLKSTATSEEILAALGGTEKISELAAAAKNKKNIIVQGDGILYSNTNAHCFFIGTLSVNLSFIRIGTSKNEYVKITFTAKASKISVISISGYKLSNKIHTLKSSSTSDEISSAIGGLDGILALKKAIEDGNTIYADADNSIIESDELSGRMQLSVIISKTNTSYEIAISGVQSEYFYAFFGNAYLRIAYNIGSNTFSCSKFICDIYEVK